MAKDTKQDDHGKKYLKQDNFEHPDFYNVDDLLSE
jgi:hypothetical protein